MKIDYVLHCRNMVMMDTKTKINDLKYTDFGYYTPKGHSNIQNKIVYVMNNKDLLDISAR